jgi:hypothetical protein
MKRFPDDRCITSRQLLLVCFLTGILCACADSANREQPPLEPSVAVETDWDSAVPRIKAVSELPTCAACTIRLDSFAVIGMSLDTVFPAGAATIVEGADQSFYVAPMSDRQKIGKYDWGGGLRALFGGKGEGPEQYYSPQGIAASPDSQLLVVSLSKALWYDLNTLRGIAKAIPVTLNQPALVAMVGQKFLATTTGGIGMSGQLYWSAPEPNGTILGRSTSPVVPNTESRNGMRMFRTVAARDTSTFYTVGKFLEPLLEVWHVGDGLFNQVELPAPWFKKYDVSALAPSSGGASQVETVPMSFHVWRDDDGLIWTLTSVPDRALPKSRPAQSPRRGEDAHRPGANRAERPLREKGDGVIAVYEVTDSSVQLVTSARFDALLTLFLSDSVVAERSYPEPGSTRFILYKLRLVRGTTIGG